MFGGTGDEGNYSAVNPPFLSSDIWNGWVLQTDFSGTIIRSDIFCQDQVNTATEYGDLVNGGFVIFNDTDAQGDTEVGVMKIINGSNTNYNLINSAQTIDKNQISKINPNLISRIQDRRGKTIFKVRNRKCSGCEKFVDQKNKFPIIENTHERVLTEETAYQMTAILKGAVERGTAKKLKSLNVPLGGKTGTTNNNFDAWFIGFSSNLVIGVYVGFDNPKSLGKFETGSKAALPIFKDFIENSLYKEDFNDFQIPENIYLTSLNYDTGLKSSLGDKNTIVEALKMQDINLSLIHI